MVDCTTFQRKLEEFDRLIHYASRRYSVPGVLDSDDLYQEGLIILNEFIEKDEFDPDSIDFRKMFKTELWHGLWHFVNATKAQKRDWKRIHSDDIRDLERKLAAATSNSKLDLPLKRGTENAHTYQSIPDARVEDFYSSEGDPQQIHSALEKLKEAHRFVEYLTVRLDKEARTVLNELLYPRTWDDIPEKFKRTAAGGGSYERQPRRKVPLHIIASILGLPLIRVRRAKNRIKREAVALASEFDLETLKEISINFLRRQVRG